MLYFKDLTPFSRAIFSKPVRRNLEDLGQLCLIHNLVTVSYYEGKLLFGLRNVEILDEFVLFLIHPIYYCEVGEYRKWLVINSDGSVEYTNKNDQKGGTFAIRVISEEEDPILEIKILRQAGLI